MNSGSRGFIGKYLRANGYDGNDAATVDLSRVGMPPILGLWGRTLDRESVRLPVQVRADAQVADQASLPPTIL